MSEWDNYWQCIWNKNYELPELPKFANDRQFAYWRRIRREVQAVADFIGSQVNHVEPDYFARVAFYVRDIDCFYFYFNRLYEDGSESFGFLGEYSEPLQYYYMISEMFGERKTHGDKFGKDRFTDSLMALALRLGVKVLGCRCFNRVLFGGGYAVNMRITTIVPFFLETYQLEMIEEQRKSR